MSAATVSPFCVNADARVQTTIAPVGRFSLAESIGFGFGQRDATPGEAVMRLGFVLDGYQQQVGAAIEELPSGELSVAVTGSDDLEAVRRHVARVLSVDIDATGWDELGTRDELIGRLQAARPGLRPPLFYSAYEAAAWSVLSARRPHAQMAALRDRLSAEHGTVIEVAGKPLPVMPTPAQLLEVRSFPGLPEIKLRRLHGVAEAALEGRLDTETLRSLAPADAEAELQKLDGIGPFYSSLVTVRTLGHTDVLPPHGEPKALEIAGELFGAGHPLTAAEYEQAASAWIPWRTWATVTIRAAGPELIAST